MSWSLIQAGQQTKQNAMSSMATLANEEQKREIANENLEQQHKQGIVAGVGSGAAIGTAIMPGIGTAVGGVVGGLAAAFM
mgnify:CR=1 FL=1